MAHIKQGGSILMKPSKLQKKIEPIVAKFSHIVQNIEKKLFILGAFSVG